MINLDLLPSTEKKFLQQQKIIYLTQEILSLFLVVLIILSIIFFAAAYILKIDYQNVQSQKIMLRKNNQNINQTIRKYNQTLKNLAYIQKNSQNFLPLIFKITALIPPHVQLFSLTLEKKVDKRNQTHFYLYLTGEAQKRSDLIILKTNLNRVAFLKNFNLPLSALVQDKNIKFKIKTEVYPQKIK